MDNKYTNGKYWEENQTLHEEDSDFKFNNFFILLNRNKLIPTNKILDLGCGAGRIIWNFAKSYPNSKCTGVDLSEKIIDYAKNKYKCQNLVYMTQNEYEKSNEANELVVLADVFEHVENYIGFLKDISSKYKYQLLNIPLDLSIRSLLNDRPLKMRSSVGHLHYFYDKLIIKILEDNGFDIVDYLYANNLEVESQNAIGFSKYRHIIKNYLVKVLSSFLGESTVSKLFGGYSLSVLCKRIS